MHELSIAQEILSNVRTALEPYPEARLERVRVAVGELTAIEPELLRFAWEALLEGTPEAGCELDVEWRPATQHCAACGVPKTRPPRGWLPLCGDCGGPLRVDGGQELDLLQVSFEVPDREDRDDRDD
ncbi:MAG TPA: hydrogenase maturation nickel metallochaperone HypA [Thermoanaerobaculaceae bacterium]|nr:hydrogenase maturation nickel metallochaperone HypA [Thermoanaerobaculaceae bacterium]HPS78866.1 hydrogenase maturation nickel metallochaperone HypA [Thermoanaerobaculaceae bacterium]